LLYAELRPAVFLDRDGTIARDVPYCRQPEDFELFAGTVKSIKTLNELGFQVILATNQSGIARGYFTTEDLTKIHLKLEKELAAGGAHLDGIYFCPHHPDDDCECRKPKPGMLLKCANDMNIDLSHSFMIGDSVKDIEAGQKAGCRSILVSDKADYVEDTREIIPDYIARDFPDAVRWLGSHVQNKGKGVL